MHDLRMRRYLTAASPLVVTAVYALVWAAWMIGYDVFFEHHGWLRSLRGDLIGGVVVAGGMWFAQRRDTSKTAWIFGDMSYEQQRDVRRAAVKGIPPEDPALRSAAVALAQYELTNFMAWRAVGVLALILAVAGSVGFAISDRSPWFAIGAVVFGASLISVLRYPARQRRRLARLEDASGR